MGQIQAIERISDSAILYNRDETPVNERLRMELIDSNGNNLIQDGVTGFFLDADGYNANGDLIIKRILPIVNDPNPNHDNDPNQEHDCDSQTLTTGEPLDEDSNVSEVSIDCGRLENHLVDTEIETVPEVDGAISTDSFLTYANHDACFVESLAEDTVASETSTQSSFTFDASGLIDQLDLDIDEVGHQLGQDIAETGTVGHHSDRNVVTVVRPLSF